MRSFGAGCEGCSRWGCGSADEGYAWGRCLLDRFDSTSLWSGMHRPLPSGTPRT